MFDYRHYVPILKGKKGEFDALRTLSSAARDRLTPVIDVPPVPTDFRANTAKTTLEKHLTKVAAKYLAVSWASTRPIFVDVSYCAKPSARVNGVHPLTFVLSMSRTKHLQVIPVVNLTADAAFRAAARNAVQQDGLGVCIRINREDCLPTRSLDKQLLELVKEVGADTRATDLIIDIRDCHEDELKRCVPDVIGSFERIPRPREWRTLTFAGGAFPSSLPNPPDSVVLLPRVELTIWHALIAAKKDLPRLPSFGDYAVAHPDHNEVDPRKMRMSPNLRYATPDAWIAVKGRMVKMGATAAKKGVNIHELCRKLVGRSEFCKAGYSWGDDFIYDRSRNKEHLGNATTWRHVGTSHHITLAGEQTAKMVVT